MFRLFRALCLLVWSKSVTSLRMEDAVEGSCHGIQYNALPHIDLDFMDTLNFMPAGNRYHIYHHSSNHPRFSEMRDFELYYYSCLHKNVTNDVISVSGFGDRLLGSYTVRPRREQNTIIDVTPIVTPYDPKRMDRIQKHITLTDYKTFIFFANCWVGADQSSWNVYSLTPELSPSARKMIEEHAVSLGFKRDQMVFLNYDSCGRDPLPDNEDESGRGGIFGTGLRWPWKGLSSGRNPIPVPGRLVPIPGIERGGIRGIGKIVLNRATISPLAGNNQLRRGNSAGVGASVGRLSLATKGLGWSRK